MGRRRKGRRGGRFCEILEDRQLLSAAPSTSLGAASVGDVEVVNLQNRLDVVIKYLGQATGLGGLLDRYQVDLVARSEADKIAAVDINFTGRAYQVGQNTATLAASVRAGNASIDSHLLLGSASSWLTVKAPAENNDERFGSIHGFGSALSAVLGIAAAGQMLDLPVAQIVIVAGESVTLSGMVANGSGYKFSFGTGIAISVSGASTAPVVTTGGAAIAFAAPGPAKAVAPNFALSDGNSTSLTGATVRITGNYAAGQDMLGFTNQSGIVGSWNAFNGTLTLAGTASVGAYQAALRSVTYANASASPSTAQRTVCFEVSDGTGVGSANQLINVARANAAPTVANVTTSVQKNVAWVMSASVFTAGFADADGQAMQKIKITTLPGRGTLKLSGSAIRVNQEIAVGQLGQLSYTPTSSYVGADSFLWTASDGLAYAATAAKVNITVSNSGPVVQNVSTSIAANSTLKFTSSLFAAGYSDVNKDAMQKIKVTSLPAHGTLLLGGRPVVVGQEISVSQLAYLTFTAAKGYVGNDSFGWNASDGTAYSLAPALFSLRIG